METKTVITLVFSSSLIASIVTALLNHIATYFFNKKKYDQEFFKLIITRRLKAYEILDLMIAQLKLAIKTEFGVSPGTFTAGQKEYLRSLKLTMDAYHKSFWYSEECAQRLLSLQAPISKANDKNL